MKKTTFRKAMFMCLSMLLTTMVFAQEHLYKIALMEQVQQSTQVIEGKVIAKQSLWDVQRHRIYTINTVEVYKVFKGQYVEIVELVTLGGTVGLDAQIVSPSLQLSKGDIGVFTLHNAVVNFTNKFSNKLKPYSGVQGFYQYNLFNNTAVNPFHVKQGITTSFYDEIKSLTNSNYINISSFDVDDYLVNSKQRVLIGGTAISTFSPTTATAGTKTVITINGSGFSNTQQNVGFLNADNGGASYAIAESTQIISWSDTQIQVEVPTGAGNGQIAIINNPPTAVLAVSSTSLSVPYAQINALSDPDDNTSSGGVNGPLGVYAYQTQHYNQNGSGGYTWQMETSFDANSNANESFIRAFDTWRCETGVNWAIGAVTTADVIADDDINIIRFGSEVASGTLGVCTSYLGGCRTGGATMQWLVTELDIVFNASTNWQFGPTNANSSQIDFETVAVHELGHGHQLSHVIDTSKIMHYALGAGDNNRVLSVSDIDGGNDVQSRSTTIAPCGASSMTNFDCSTLTNEDFVLSQEVYVYPNPVQESLFVKNTINTTIEQITIYDVNGKLVLTPEEIASKSLITINVNSLSQGVYFVKIKSENASFTKRIIVK